MNFIERVEQFIAACKEAKRPIPRITVAVSEKYALRRLGIPKGHAVEYNGVLLKCIGSKRWRQKQWEDTHDGLGRPPSHTSGEPQS